MVMVTYSGDELSCCHERSPATLATLKTQVTVSFLLEPESELRREKKVDQPIIGSSCVQEAYNDDAFVLPRDTRHLVEEARVLRRSYILVYSK